MSDKQNDLGRPVEQMRAEATSLRQALYFFLFSLGAFSLLALVRRNWKSGKKSRTSSITTLYPMPVELPAQASQTEVYDHRDGGEDEGPEPLQHGRFRAIKNIGGPTSVEVSEHDDYSAKR